MNWDLFIKEEQEKDYFKNLTCFLEEEFKTKTIFPRKEDIFNAFKLCSFENTKVIILGQDPYHEVGQAHGLAFSVMPGCKLPPSLRNIYKELSDDTGDFKLTGDLSSWASQGVLLLNTILTVEEGKPLAHKNKGWEIFTDNVIKKLDEDNTPKVFILWGAKSIEKSSLISNPKHLVLTANHPSPLSAYRGFFGCKHFSKTNEFLKNNNRKEIDWSL